MRKRLGQFEEVKKDAVAYGRFIVENRATYRKTADHFGVHHTRVHRYIQQILREEDAELFSKVISILEMNKQDKHLRGGEATQQKYKG